MNNDANPGGPHGDVGPEGSLQEVVIHKDGSEEPVQSQSLLARLLGWFK